MPKKRPPTAVIVLIVIVLAIAGYYFYSTQQTKTNGTLQASGTIESRDVRISPEIGGKVADVFVDEGDQVHAGDLILRIDDSLLGAQRVLATASLETAKAAASTALAAVDSAQAQYLLAVDNAMTEEQANRATAWQHDTPGEFDQPLWYFTRTEQLKAAQAEAGASQAELTKAEDHVKKTAESASAADFVTAEARLLAARAAYLATQDVFDRADKASSASDLRDAAQAALDDAQTELTDAEKDYDDAMTTEGAADVLSARAELAVAQERYDTANDRLRAQETGLDSPRVAAAHKLLDQAKMASAQADTAIQQAQANLSLIDTQLGKLDILAPADGVILTRAVEPGEVIAPGATAMSLGLLGDLTITVYVPEDRYGEISLGQKADVSVDSFPGETFSAVVTHIADQAQFTPRNVQTAEGRATTVYAIELRVQDPEGNLKPGMPADVAFQ